jgi:hypothetical protein
MRQYREDSSVFLNSEIVCLKLFVRVYRRQLSACLVKGELGCHCLQEICDGQSAFDVWQFVHSSLGEYDPLFLVLREQVDLSSSCS